MKKNTKTIDLKELKRINFILLICISIITFIAFIICIFNNEFFNFSFKIDSELASKFGNFFGGFVGTLFIICNFLFLSYSFITQSIDKKKDNTVNNFFKMLDYHYNQVNQLKILKIKKNEYCSKYAYGKRAFVVFKMQLSKLLIIIEQINEKYKLGYSKETIADIAYISLFYGVNKEFEEFSKKRLNKLSNANLFVEELQMEINNNKKYKLGRTNQTYLSAYFRNLYNSIKLIDSDIYLSDEEKQKYIKILRAQLSDTELYIIFFNLLSRFGEKWKKNDYIIKYEFIKNIPSGYTEDYKPNDYFPMEYEEDYYNEEHN